ncbi:MAG: hypothetical protein IJS81_09520, partial [Selenomonadaceae bacterium]|nr:hypothetical protein [Selenomonadaceae bacterium]
RDAVSEKKVVSDLRKVAATPDKTHFTQMNFDEYFNDAPKSDFIIDPQNDNPALTVEELRSAVDSRKKDMFDDDDDFFREENILHEEMPPSPQIDAQTLEKFYPIGQVALCYIVAQSDSDLYLLDQHAAHERILFDKLSSYADEIPAQILLIHQNLKFDSRETAAIENNLELFNKLGFTLELSGENEFRLTSMPVDAANADAGAMLREIISSLPDEDLTAQVDDKRRAEIAVNIRKKFIAIASCRGAIKAGQKLSRQEIDALINDLSKTPHPHTCPHGRPTVIKFSSADLAKMFKRT